VYRSLPPRCNLEHLRKQAKAVLRVVGRRKNGWRLADAQHAVARGYGFPSWSKLKAHVESVALASVGGLIEPQRRATGTQEASRHEHPISGPWTTSRATSKPRWSSTNQDVMLSVDVAGDVMTFTEVWLDRLGHELASRMTIRADGQEHPLDSSGTVLQASWINARVLEVTVKRGNQTVGRGQYELSEDRTTLTASTTEHVLVFERA
jgi:hypothetical protein